MDSATIVQLIGSLLIVVGCYVLALWLGLIVTGLLLGSIGYFMEREAE